jgi:bacillithiol system protein YtxJ
MHPKLTHLETVGDVDSLLAESATRPVLIFKHSDTCGTSFEALDELVEHLNESTLDVRYAMVTVQDFRDVSTAIASKLGVRHETPQALLVRDGRVLWAVSHFRVTAAAVEAALKGQAVGSR